MFEKILAPTDGSQLALKAVAQAVAIAAKFNSMLIVLAVLDTRALSTSELLGMDEAILRMRLKNESEKHLAEAESIAKREKITIEKVIREGNPAEEILREAEAKSINLIVIGSKGLTGARRVIVGSTAEEVLRWSSCPVLIVR
jgi:nucleotide-binding universal stress UspA family protein